MTQKRIKQAIPRRDVWGAIQGNPRAYTCRGKSGFPQEYMCRGILM